MTRCSVLLGRSRTNDDDGVVTLNSEQSLDDGLGRFSEHYLDGTGRFTDIFHTDISHTDTYIPIPFILYRVGRQWL